MPKIIIRIVLSICSVAVYSQVELDWVQHYGSELYPSGDVANDAVFDEAGNIYVTGVSQNENADEDYLTIKYSSNGELIWERRYDGSLRENERAQAITIGGNGNIFVTGGNEKNCITVKYDPQGNEIWTATYEGNINTYYEGYDIIADNAGNSYVSVSIVGGGQLIKYDVNGTASWVVGQEMPSEDVWYNLNAICVDQKGYVYLTGSICFDWDDEDYFSPDDCDFVTTKYSPNGTIEWTVEYNGTDSTRSTASDVHVDSESNVYVTGTDAGLLTTLKYDLTGTVLWQATFDSADTNLYLANKIFVDEVGNVYVTGNWRDNIYGPPSSIITVKYSANGVLDWYVNHTSQSGVTGWNPSMALDTLGNIYVSFGMGDIVTIKYGPDGYQQWLRTYTDSVNAVNLSAMQVDFAGNVIVIGYPDLTWDDPNSDYLTLKYSPIGERLWVVTHDGPNHNLDVIAALGVDKEGCALVTGTNYDGIKSYVTTLKYSADGKDLWSVRYDDVTTGRSSVHDLALDDESNVYVSGFDGKTHINVFKYSSAGENIWAAKITNNSELNSGTSPFTAITTDEDYIYTTGTLSATDGGTGNTVTVKYSKNGDKIWTAIYDAGVGRNLPRALAVDSDGNIYVVGSSEGINSNGPHCMATIKYDSAGNQVWVREYWGSSPSSCQYGGAEAVTLDNDGSIYVLGHRCGMGVILIKYLPDGTSVWTNIVEYIEDETENGLVLDSEGNIYAVGEGDIGMAIIKYSSDGNEEWVEQYPGHPNAVVIDTFDNIYVTGEPDFTTIKYAPDGSQEWVYSYSDSIMDKRVACELSMDQLGNVYVAGTSSSLSGASTYTVLKLSQSGNPTGHDQGTNTPQQYSLDLNYPNPFNPSTTISYALPTPSDVTLTVYDLTGRAVTTLADTHQPAGSYGIQWNGKDDSGDPVSAGVYLCRLAANKYVRTIKMVYLK